jgi:hypothetical protein
MFYDILHDFQEYAEKYAEDQETFFKDYAEAHAKLSNLGAKFDPPEVCHPLMIVFVEFMEDANQKKLVRLIQCHIYANTSDWWFSGKYFRQI